MAFETAHPANLKTQASPKISLAVRRHRLGHKNAHIIINAAARRAFFATAQDKDRFNIRFGTGPDAGSFILDHRPVDGPIFCSPRGPTGGALTLVLRPWDAISGHQHYALACQILGETPQGVLLRTPQNPHQFGV